LGRHQDRPRFSPRVRPKEVVEDEAREAAKLLKKRRPVWLAILSNLFYVALLAGIVLAGLNFAASNDARKSVFGFRPYFVYTSSMEPDLPKGSLIIVKLLEAREVQLHDYLTYYLPGGTEYRTHEVIEIFEDYQESGYPGFRTKGINATGPDRDIVPGQMAVGRVVFCLPQLGWLLDWMNERIYTVAAILLGICALFWVLGRVARNRKPKPKTSPEEYADTDEDDESKKKSRSSAKQRRPKAKP
jgi:signal peptidase